MQSEKYLFCIKPIFSWEAVDSQYLIMVYLLVPSNWIS